jgi:hypothetical protein
MPGRFHTWMADHFEQRERGRAGRLTGKGFLPTRGRILRTTAVNILCPSVSK